MDYRERKQGEAFTCIMRVKWYVFMLFIGHEPGGVKYGIIR
jgi:hypothetical protein